MASILKVDTIQDQSGNNIINESADTITIGASGDTITIPAGATLTVPMVDYQVKTIQLLKQENKCKSSITDLTAYKSTIWIQRFLIQIVLMTIN
jgi:PhoPQ-activated pathogenicity-related protein